MTHPHSELGCCYTRCLWRHVKAVRRCSARQPPVSTLVYQAEQQQAQPFGTPTSRPEEGAGERGRQLAAAWHPLVSWEIIPLADLTHECTPNNSSQPAWLALAIGIGSRWCSELSQLCHSGPRVSESHPFLDDAPCYPCSSHCFHKRTGQTWQGTVRTEGCTSRLFRDVDSTVCTSLKQHRWLFSLGLSPQAS